MKANAIKSKATLVLIAVSLIAGIAHSQQVTSSFTEAQTALAPLVFLALFIDAGIIGIWYLLGVLLSNNKVKAGAISEVYQFFGTGVMLIAIIFFMVVFSSLFYSTLSQDPLMSPQTLGSICQSLTTNSQLAIFNPSISQTHYSLLSSTQNQNAGLCAIISGQSAPGSNKQESTLNSQIDYPLAAVGVILANLTNQTVTNLNSTFIEDSFISFMSSLHPFVQFCFAPSPSPLSAQCLLPNPVTPPELTIGFHSGPWSGYSLIYQGYATLSSLIDLSAQFFIAQMIILVIMLQVWPYLLFAGLILRATPFTRKLAGLLIAIGIGVVLIYPTVFALEYITLGSGVGNAFAPSGATSGSSVTANIATVYGFNTLYDPSGITFIPANADPSSNTPYQLNFFVMPSMKVAMQHTGCWLPQGYSLLTAEGYDLLWLTLKSVFLTAAAFQVSSFYSGSLPTLFQIPVQCTPANAINSLIMSVNIYGVTGISAFFIPVINLIITLSAVLGLSGMFGGTTKLFGLEKLI